MRKKRLCFWLSQEKIRLTWMSCSHCHPELLWLSPVQALIGNGHRSDGVYYFFIPHLCILNTIPYLTYDYMYNNNNVKT